MLFNRRFGFSFLLLLGIALFCSQLYSGLILKTFWNDGAGWIYNVINERSFYRDDFLSRYVVYLPQLPAVLWMKLFPDHASIAFEVWSQSFFFILMPYLTLMGLSWYLWRKNQLQLILYPLIYFVLIHSHALHYAVNVASDGSMVFWVLVFLFRFESGWRLFLLALPGILFLTFGYELAPVYFGCLILILMARWRILKDIVLGEALSGSLLLFTYSCWYYYIFVFSMDQRGMDHAQSMFQQSFLAVPHGLGLFKWICLGVMSFVILTCNRFPKMNCLVIILGATYAIYDFYQLTPMQTFMASFHSRTTVYPVTAVLMILGLYFEYRQMNRAPLYWILGTGLLVASIENSQMNQYWNRGIRNLQTTIEQQPGCSFVSLETYFQSFQSNGLTSWTVPHLSVLMQHTRNPRGIVIPQRFRGVSTKETNACTNRIGETITSVGRVSFPISVARPGGFVMPFIE